MKKIAEDVTVCVKTYFGKQRPFPVVRGNVCAEPTFPGVTFYHNEVTGRKTPITSDCLTSGVIRRPLFMEGYDYRVGIYYGDIYSLGEKPYLFRIVREPSKTLLLPHEDGSSIKLIVESGGLYTSIFYHRTDSVEGDMELLERKIKILKGCISDLHDLASPNIETYVRRYYLLKKLNMVGRKK